MLKSFPITYIPKRTGAEIKAFNLASTTAVPQLACSQRFQFGHQMGNKPREYKHKAAS